MTRRRSGRAKGKLVKVRHVRETSIRHKRFKPVHDLPKKACLSRVHPLVVVADLRNGCLDSLGEYLRQERGIPDREVVLELRKLIAGTHYRSDYRLIVVEHPDRPAAKGGAPKKNGRPPDLAFRIAKEYRARWRKGEVESLVKELAKEFGVKDNTVYKYVGKVKLYEEAVRADKEAEQKNAALARSLTWGQWVRILASASKERT